MDKKLTFEERQAEKRRKADIMRPLVIAECRRVIELLEHTADNDHYNYGEYTSAELFNKMHELRRDTITLEKIQKSW